MIAQLQVGQNLRFVNWQDRFYRLDFDNEHFVDKKIDSKPSFDPNPIVDHWQSNLSFHPQSALLQFV